MRRGKRRNVGGREGGREGGRVRREGRGGKERKREG